MNAQRTLDDALAARDAAIARVAANTGEEWVRWAVGIVRIVADGMDEFTTDDIRLNIDFHGGYAAEWRVLGAVMREAARRRYCEPTGRYRQSQSRVNHARPQMIWRSLRREAVA